MHFVVVSIFSFNIAPANGSGVNEVALLQNFKNSRNPKGQFHLTPCYMKCFFGEGKKEIKFFILKCL